MKLANWLRTVFLSAGSITVCSLSAEAHSVTAFPVPKLHFSQTAKFHLVPTHGISAHSTFGKTALLGPPGLSGSGRALYQAQKNVIFTNFQGGGAHFLGGAITGGQLSGTLYLPQSPQGLGFGTYVGNVGTVVNADYNTIGAFSRFGTPPANPSFPNGITFANPYNPLGPVAFTPAKGLQGFLNQLGARAFGLGENSAAQSFGHLQGGFIVGTFYRNSINSPIFANTYGIGSTRYGFAFGNSPFNTGAIFTSINLPSQSYVQLANGKIFNFTNGQFLFPLSAGSPGIQGSLFTFGNNPLNNFALGGIATDLRNFAFFH